MILPFILGNRDSIVMKERYELTHSLLDLSEDVWDSKGEDFSFSLLVLSKLSKEEKITLRHDEEKDEWIVKIKNPFS
jgi:hypothetical protein